MENVGSKWVQEIQEHCPGVKIVLVALKCDLREEQEGDDDEEKDASSPPRRIVTYAEGLEVAKTVGALRYLGRAICESGLLLIVLMRLKQNAPR